MASEWTPEPTLRLVAGPTPAQSIALTAEPVTIGRHKTNSLVLGEDHQVSRHHATVRRDGLRVLLSDNATTNGTTVNGERVEHEVLLRDGDRIKISEHVFEFRSPLVTLSDEPDVSNILQSIDLSGPGRTIPRVSAEERLSAILEISRDLGRALHLREVLAKTLGSLFRIFPQAERGFLLLRQKDRAEPIVQAVRHRDAAGGPMTVSTTVFAHVMDQGRAILSENLPRDFGNGDEESLAGTDIRTLLAVPLMNHEGRPNGMIQLDTSDQRSRFSQDDLGLLVAVAGPIGLAVENADLHEALVRYANIRASLENARQVQLAMLPGSRPEVAGYEFFDAYEPAETVGGDYYDYLPLTGANLGRWAVPLGDVSGHGMPAALLMARLASEARMSFLTEPDPALAVERLNRQLVDDRFPDRFITFLGTILDPVAHTLTILNAGHMGPMIRRASGEVEVVGEEVGGPPLALYAGLKFRPAQTEIGVGDVVVLYTDGVNEAMNAEEKCLKVEGLARAVLEAEGRAECVGEAILAAVHRHMAGCPQSDDIGVVCIGRV